MADRKESIECIYPTTSPDTDTEDDEEKERGD
jgi:hypothetical protein